MSEEEISQLKLQRDTAIFVARERLDEIERIKNQKEIFELRYLKSDKEIERLNNIINEFETLIKHEITESIFEDNYGRVDAMEYCLATLRELKGEDKE